VKGEFIVRSSQFSAISDQFPMIRMKPKPTLPPRFDATVASQLACPACFGKLEPNGSLTDAAQPVPTHLVCTACLRAYPIVDGIPVLIIEHAETDRANSPAT
jgi:uncharacterized protein YbaR (Trm112 family)